MKRMEDMTEPELKSLMNNLAKIVDFDLTVHAKYPHQRECPKFAILVFNDPKVAQYVSNCDRALMIQALRETADRLERNEDIRRDL